jgi:hypothetical protein
VAKHKVLAIPEAHGKPEKKTKGGLPCPMCGRKLHPQNSHLENNMRIRRYERCKCGFRSTTVEKFNRPGDPKPILARDPWDELLKH